MVICLQRGADLHMAQLMPLPLTVSCFSKIQIGFTFLKFSVNCKMQITSLCQEQLMLTSRSKSIVSCGRSYVKLVDSILVPSTYTGLLSRSSWHTHRHTDTHTHARTHARTHTDALITNITAGNGTETV